MKSKNIPIVIYLQSDSEDYADYTDGVNWCSDQISQSDIRYVRTRYLEDALSRRIKELDDEIKTINTATMSGNKKANRLRGIKKELKDWLTSTQIL